jgi:hypothetical protein
MDDLKSDSHASEIRAACVCVCVRVLSISRVRCGSVAINGAIFTAGVSFHSVSRVSSRGFLSVGAIHII